MLQLIIPSTEMYDENKECFINSKGCILQLEHSLISVSKWESKWKKPFLTKDQKTPEELIDYVRCMTINPQSVPDSEIYSALTQDMMKQISDYIDDSHTATWFSEKNQKQSREIITSEIIYYWMIASEIPFECQKWHLNRLLTLIRICSIKNEEASNSAKKKGPKINKSSLASRNTALNMARRKSLGSTG